MKHRIRQPQRILIVNPFGIGDVLFTTPLVRAVGQAFAGSRIAYVCNRRTERILRDNPHLDELFVHEKDEVLQLWRSSPWQGARWWLQFVRRLARARFDLAIDLSLGERYGLLLALVGVPRRVGFDYRHRGRFMTATLTIDGYHEEHVVEYYRRLLHLIGVRMVEGSLELPVAEADERWADEWMQKHRVAGRALLVGILPGGGVSWGIDAPVRRWSFEGFAKVGDALIERFGAQVLLFGEATDAPICQTVARLMHDPAIDLSGQTTLGQFISFLARLDLVICNDGGPLHLAVSQGVRTVSIFGPVDPNVYGPYPAEPSRHRVVCRQHLPCRPCYHQFKLPPCPYERACLTGVEPEEVIEACTMALGETASGDGSRP